MKQLLTAAMLLGLLSLQATSWAQESQPPGDPTPHSESSPESEGTGGEGAQERAIHHFNQGILYVRREHWEAALTEFEASLRYRDRPSAFFNRALCLKNLHRYTEALAALRDYLERYGAEATEEHRAQVDRMMDEVRRLLTEVAVEVNLDGALIFVDDSLVGEYPLSEPLLLLSGPHIIEARHEGYRTARRRIVVVASQTNVVELELVEPARLGRVRVESNVEEAAVFIDGEQVGTTPHEAILPEGNHRIEVQADGYIAQQQSITVTRQEDRIAVLNLDRPTRVRPGWFWATAGVTIAGALATGGLAVAVYLLNEDYDPNSRSGWDDYNRGSSLVVATDVTLGITCAFAIAAVILGLYTDWNHPADSARSRTSRLLAAGPGLFRW